MFPELAGGSKQPIRAARNPSNPMARPYWQGSIQISLVSAQVSLFPASNSARAVEFHQIDRETGERVHHQNVVDSPDENAHTVDKTDLVKGYEYEKGKYIAIDPEEIKRLRLKSQKTLEVVQFVGMDEVDLEFFEKPYYVVPKDNAQARVLAILRKALEDTRTIGLGEITMSGREHLVALAAPVSPEVRGLMLYVMRYEEELRDPADYYTDVADTQLSDKDDKQVALAKQLIDSYKAPFDASRFKDDYEASLRELVEAKLQGKKLPPPAKEPKRGKVIDLMDALKRSVAARQKTGESPAPHSPRHSSAPRTSTRTKASKKQKVA
jgi:DNA end-binding protein Ku